MSLNYNFSKVKDHEALHEDEWEWHITNALIWATMSVGIREIKEDNIDEFYARLHMEEKLFGAHLIKDRKDYFITRTDIERRVGLTTNASTFTRPQFIKLKVGRYFKELTGKEK